MTFEDSIVFQTRTQRHSAFKTPNMRCLMLVDTPPNMTQRKVSTLLKAIWKKAQTLVWQFMWDVDGINRIWRDIN